MELIGKVLAKRYTVVEKLGHGGYGDVYRAFDDESIADVESPMDSPTFILAKDGCLRYASLDETAVLQ